MASMSDMMQEGVFPTLTPYMVVRDARGAIAFYGRAFGAVVRNLAEGPDGKVMNAQLVIGDSVLMLNDEYPEWGSVGPQAGERMPLTIHITSKNIEEDWQRAVDAGVEITMPLEDQFWGDRYGQFKCPYGYNWSMSQRVKQLSPEQVEAAMHEAFGSHGQG